MLALHKLAATPTRDPEARQVALRAINDMKRGRTYSAALLKQAVAANSAFAQRQNDATLGQRAVLAQKLYNARLNTEVARYMAAFALLAEAQGNTAASASTVAQQVTESRSRGIALDTARAAKLRRDVLLQAAEKAAEALKNAPPLPAQFVARQTAMTQVSRDPTMGWRAPAWVMRASQFFPTDVVAAAGGLQGFGTAAPGSWLPGLRHAIETNATVIRHAAHTCCLQCAQNNDGAAGIVQRNLSGVLSALDSLK